MSHFTEMQVNFLQSNEAQLIAALEQCFGEGSVEVHDSPEALYGYKGDNRAEAAPGSADYAPPCHLIVRRKKVGKAANDIGYRRTEDGKYAAYISEYDSGANFSSEKQSKVLQDYTVGVTEKQMKLQGYSVKKVPQANGKVTLTLSRYIK